jgi:hypothetical protein
MRFLSTIDIFGTEFQFTTFEKHKYKTQLGGIFTILCIFSLIILTLILGQDFFYTKNPKLYLNVETPEGPPLPK